jgi:hypothetical protein
MVLDTLFYSFYNIILDMFVETNYIIMFVIIFFMNYDMVFNTLWSICVDKYFDKVPDITFKHA